MKSREGTVVDADDLITEMTNYGKIFREELGKIRQITRREKNKVYKTIG